MSTNGFAKLAARLRPADDTDRDLLARFLQEHDDAAFEALVRRHERLVRSAVAKVLTSAHDAEDAFQATFLVLVRRAKGIDWRAGLGPWLYGVAHRVAVKARASGQGRQRREAKATPPQPTESADLSWREACDLLHAELDQLPDRYRAPLLLCYLDGKTRDEAAAALGVTVGTVKGRLERGRDLLRDRLGRRGVSLTAGLLAAVAAPTAVACSPASASAVLATVRGAATARVVALTREAVMTSILSKLTKSLVAVVLVATTAVLAAGTAAPTGASEQDKPPAPKPAVAKEEAAPQSFTVGVAVTTPDGKPAAGADVWVWADGKKQAAGKADAAGRLDLTVPTFFDKVTVVASAAGFGPDWAEFRPVFPGIIAPTKLTLVADVPLQGRVTDLQDHPVADVPVSIDRVGRPKAGKTIDAHLAENLKSRGRTNTALFDLDTISAAALGLPARVTTDKDGRFKLAGVGADRSVRITARGDTTEHLQARVVTRAIDAKLEQQGPFGLHGATFTLQVAPSRPLVGHVRDFKTGRGVPGMKVTDLRHQLCEATTDADGKFTLRGLKKDTAYHLGTGSLGESPYFDVNMVVNDTPGLDPIDVEFKAHRGIVVTGRVTDAKGKPVAGRMHCDRTYDNPSAKEYPGIDDAHMSISYWGHLDKDGRYKALALPGRGAVAVCASPEDAFPRLDGQKELFARKVRSYPSDAVHAVRDVDFDPADPKSLVHDFTLTGGQSRALRIVGVDGKLPAKLLGVGQTETWAPKPVESDTLAVAGLSPKRSRAVVLIDEAKTVGAVAAVSAGDGPATVTLQKLGSLTGRVLDADGNPAANAEVKVWLTLDDAKYDNLPDEVYAERGVFGVARGAWQHFTGRTVKTDQDGRFTVPGLLPGEKYRLAAGFDLEKQDGELLHRHAGVTVEAGEAKSLGDLKPAK